jgi:pleiotropic regulator 1
MEKKKAKAGTVIAPAPSSTTAGDVDSGVEKILDTLPKKAGSQQSSALVMHKPTIHNPFPDTPGGGTSLVRRPIAKAIRPEWHAPWKLMRVISGHQGWVRSVAVEPGNSWFATGAGDRIIKVLGTRLLLDLIAIYNRPYRRNDLYMFNSQLYTVHTL